MDRDSAIALAEEHGVKIDKRLSAEAILQSVKDAGVAIPAPSEPTVTVRLLADAWVPDRLSQGSVVDLPVGIARGLLDNRRAERADPIPGLND